MLGLDKVKMQRESMSVGKVVTGSCVEDHLNGKEDSSKTTCRDE